MRDYASLFKTLLQDLGLSADQIGSPITSDMGPNLAARYALASSFYKKLCPSGNTQLADRNALIKFKAINDRLADVPEDFEASNEAESCFYDYYRDNLRRSLDLGGGRDFDLDFIREHMDVGPGSAQKADSRWQIVKLFESTISYHNPHLISLYRGALVETGVWADAERQRFERYGFTKVEGGKIFFASKNAEISRTCCTEPSLEMILQKAVGAFLEERLGQWFGIYLNRQPDLNAELARIGSIDGTFGTIDLVSASDSIGLKLIQRDFPDGRLKGLLLGSRCKYAILPDGSKVELRMVSTMGNGFTFPLQTLIFASAVRACYQVMGFPSNPRDRDFGVFGDDIIVRQETYNFVCRMLQKLGFEVNVLKSFNTGPFRESCGEDWYSGHNVRGIYVVSLETPQLVYSCFNRLSRWSAYQGVPLRATLSLLKTWVRDIRIPPSEADDAGLKVPFKLTVPKLTNTYWFKYRYYKRRINRISIDVDDSVGTDSKEPAYHHENSLAVAAGFLKGVYRRRDYVVETDGFDPWKKGWSVSVSLRDRIGARARYQIVSKSLPYWDYTIPKMCIPVDDDMRRYPLTGVSQGAWEGALVDLQIFDL